jgi:hypothetical protein
MESANSSRTYTAQTCKLQVTIVPAPVAGLARPTGDFTLQIDRTEDPNGKPIVLNGQLEQLDKLQQSVSQYEAQLVAQFPMGTTEHVAELVDDGSPEPIPEATVVNRLYPTQPSGLIKNLPGLRQKSPELPVAPTPSKESNVFSALSISKLLSRSNPATSSLTAPDSPIPPKSVPSPTIDRSGTLPRLTAGDRPLEHKLYLSDNNSGRVLTLAQSQIFDLVTVLNEYTANKLTVDVASPVENRFVPPPIVDAPVFKAAPIEAIKFEAPKIEAVKFEAPKIETPPIEAPAIKALKIETPPIEAPAIKALKIETPPIEDPAERGEKFSSIATTSALSRLPNLPTLPAKTSRKSYEYVDDSQPAFMSALPWVGAAALVVGVPLLLFGSNPDLLKDSMAKVKLPIDPQHMFDSKKGEKPSKTAKPPANPTGDGVANAATADLPKPWENKPVQPPAATTATVPGTPIPQPPGANQIGIAPLPPSIANVTEEPVSTAQNPPTAPVSAVPVAVAASAPAPKNQTATSIAPNPPGSKLPDIDNLVNKKQLPTAATPSTTPKTPKSATAVATKPKTIKPATVAAKPKSNNSITPLPISVSSTGKAPKQKKANVTLPNPDNIAVSRQPMPLQPAFKGIGNEQPLTSPAAKAVKPTPVKQQKKVVVKSKSKRVVVAKKVANVTPLQTRKPKEAVTIIPVQPADPATVPSDFANPPGMPQNTPATPPIVNEPQLQSNNNSNTYPFDSPSLKETKRFFEAKWRADSTQTTPLQYVIQVNGKSGLVQSVSPQGEAASTYLKKTGMLKLGQKLVSPTPGEGEQKIRVLLQPDGNVDTFVEP